MELILSFSNQFFKQKLPFFWVKVSKKLLVLSYTNSKNQVILSANNLGPFYPKRQLSLWNMGLKKSPNTDLMTKKDSKNWHYAITCHSKLQSFLPARDLGTYNNSQHFTMLTQKFIAICSVCKQGTHIWVPRSTKGCKVESLLNQGLKFEFPVEPKDASLSPQLN